MSQRTAMIRSMGLGVGPAGGGGGASVIRIPPYTFIHVLNTNTNVTSVELGPQTFTRQEHCRIVEPPKEMVKIPPRHYVEIVNPVMREADGTVALDRFGQARLRFGDVEFRLSDDYPEPFPLFPGETQEGAVRELEVVLVNTALHLRALRDHAERKAGDEWHFVGPATYIPRPEVERVKKIKARVIKHNMALRVRARRKCVDAEGSGRMAGEEYLVRTRGAFMPQVEEEVLGEVKAFVLTERKALCLRALKTFVDVYGKKRKAGEEWLVTFAMAETHLIDVYEERVDEVEITTLTDRQFAVVLDPYVDGEQVLGTKSRRVGECSFFLLPGETLEAGIQDVFVLGENEALLLKAQKAFVDPTDASLTNSTNANAAAARAADASSAKAAAAAGGGIARRPGDLWMVYGPCEFVPSTDVKVIEKRTAIPLDENEGIYIRDLQSGRVRAVVGETYMLEPTETLWEKALPDEVEALLLKQSFGNAYVAPSDRGDERESWSAGGGAEREERRGARRALPALRGRSGRSSALTPAARDKSKVVTFRVPHNAALYVYDYKKKKPRVIFGPELVMLGPDEQFTVIRLSGDKPKKPNVISTLTLMLGPDFMTDIVTVETSDHARLQLTLSYNWRFDVDRDDPVECMEIFSVRDFTGDACKAIASRVRGAVAAETFDNFHKYSAKMIRSSVFGMTPEGKVRDKLVFENNHLVITNVDVQSVEPVDAQTRQSLQKSVQLAIEITTKSQEARARHEAQREEELAKGQLQQQRLKNESAAERTKKGLLELQAASKAVESQGQATAEARAKAEAAQIEAEASVSMANAKARAMTIEAEARMKQLAQEQKMKVEHEAALMKLEVEKARQLGEIEAKKFTGMVDALGPETIAAIARAGPEMKAKLLAGLGLKGLLVTDGKNPINLFQTADGMLGAPSAAAMVANQTASA